MSNEPKCPSCGGKDVKVITFQGREYYQCWTVRPDKHGPCKYWSTKWAPAPRRV